MSRGQFLPANEHAEVVYYDEPEFSGQSTDADSKVEALASALKADPAAFVNVHRILAGGNAPEEFCTRIPADKFDYGQLLEYLARTFGGGEYRVRLYAKGKIVSNQLVPIASAIKNDVRTTAAGEASGILATVLERMEANNIRMLQMMERAITQKVEPQHSRIEMLKEMMMFKQLFGESKSHGGLGQIQESISLLKELGINVGSKSDDDDGESFTSLLGKVAPLIVQAAQQPAQTQPAQNPIQPARNPEMLLSMKIRNSLKPFLTAAAKNADQTVYAEMLLDQLPHNIVASHILPDNAIDKLVAIEPQVGLYRAWFELLKAHVKAQLNIPSIVSHLYDDEESDITQNSELTGDIDDGDNVPFTGD